MSVVAQAAPPGYKASEPMLMWEALRQATDEARGVRCPAQQPVHGSHTPRAPLQELERDPTVMVMGEDVGHYGGSYKVRALGEPAATAPRLIGDASPLTPRPAAPLPQVTYDLYKKYGEFRLLDTPICEYSFMVRPFSQDQPTPAQARMSRVTKLSFLRSALRRAWVSARP